MSDETTRKLNEAKAEEAEQQSRTDDRKLACLSAVAHGIPMHVDNIAKRTAHSQPQVARELGKDGIKRLRKELADAATALASEVERAAGQIEWPVPQSAYSRVSASDVRTTLFKFLYGARVDSLASIIKSHGFSINDDDRQRSQSLILPQFLFDEDDFTDLAEALNSLAVARQNVTTAQAADNQDAVNALWEDDES